MGETVVAVAVIAIAAFKTPAASLEQTLVLAATSFHESALPSSAIGIANGLGIAQSSPFAAVAADIRMIGAIFPLSV